MNTIIEFLKKKAAAMRAAKKMMRKAEIESLYRVTEKGGKLYITCNGSAVYEIKDDSNAKTIVGILEEARKTALKFVGIDD